MLRTLASVSFALFCAPSLQVMNEWMALKKDLKTLTKINDGLRAEADGILADTKALTSNPAYIERTIRDELGYVRRSDITLLLD